MRVKFLTFVLALSLIGLVGVTSESYAANQAGVSPTLTAEPKYAHPSGGSEDSDNDSYSDLCEYLHKTDPNDAESKPSSNITINVPSDVKTIQGAINVSIDGDTIVVSQGKYQGNINFNGRTITLTSTDPQSSDVVANTIIEGTEQGSVITIDSNSALKGFTITSKGLDCRGIYCKDASPTIENCTIIDNQTTALGGGIYSTDNSSPQITNCIITGNADSTGSKSISIQVFGGAPQIVQSWINSHGLVDNTTSSDETNTTNEELTYQTITVSEETDDLGVDTTTSEQPSVQTPIIPDAATAMEPATIIQKPENSDATTTTDTSAYEVYSPYAVHFTGLIMAGECNYETNGWSKAFDPEDSCMPHSCSDMVEPGEYPDTAEAIPTAVYATLDGIAIRACTRVIIYSEKNFQGDILLDKNGPAIINNVHWINDPRYNVVMTEDWPEPLQSEFPQSVREWSETDMYDRDYLWGHGSFKIIAEEWWYVDDDAPLGGDGRTWDTAFTHLQDALNNPELQTGDQISVGQGTYKPDQDNVHPNGTGNRTATFQLINDVTIKGGYAGFGAPNPYVRDIEAYPTILSGDLLGNDGPNFTNYEDNSYHVVTGSGTDATAILDGFTITCGNADGSPSYNYGGGMYNADGSPTVTNCIFSANLAVFGGAIFSGPTSIEINSCQVLNQPNTTYYLTRDLSGAEVTPKCINITAEGITFDGQGYSIKNPNLEDAVIYSEANNVTIRNADVTASLIYGGSQFLKDAVIYSQATNATIKKANNATIRNADVTASSQYFPFVNNGYGKGIEITADYNIVENNTVTDTFWGIITDSGDSNIIQNNTIDGNAKGIHLTGNNNIIKNNLIKNNTRSEGWGMAVWIGEHNQFINNKVYGNMYGIVLYGTNHTLLKCDQYYNNSQDIYLYEDNYEGDPSSNNRDVIAAGVTYSTIYIGSGAEFSEHQILWCNVDCTWSGDVCEITTIINEQSFPTFTNCIFADNSASYGGGVFSSFSSIELVNCVFTGNSATYGGGIDINGCSGSYLSKLINCTFNGNSATYGDAMYNFNSDPIVTNCILWNSGEEIYNTGTSNPTITYSDIEGGYAGEGNINSDPLFVDANNPAGADGIFRTSDDGLQLDEGSPCTNAANHLTAPPTDILGNGRFGIADIGAYEFDLDGWTTYGTHGSGVGEFDYPYGIYYDNASEYIYIADSNNSRIVKTKIDGTGWTTYGTEGWGVGEFTSPCGIYYDSASEYIYVADTYNGRIVKTKIDGTGWTILEGFNNPRGISYDNASEYIYVADTYNDRIVKTKIDGTGWTTYGTSGWGVGEFTSPCGIYYDSASEYIYVADTYNGRIVKTKIDGTGWTILEGFNNPRGIYYDSALEYIYVACRGYDYDWNQRIVKTKIDGTGWDSYGIYDSGAGVGQFCRPSGISYDNATGYIYVADTCNNRIVRVALPGW